MCINPYCCYPEACPKYRGNDTLSREPVPREPSLVGQPSSEPVSDIIIPFGASAPDAPTPLDQRRAAAIPPDPGVWPHPLPWEDGKTRGVLFQIRRQTPNPRTILKNNIVCNPQAFRPQVHHVGRFTEIKKGLTNLR
jgi:hypothetical protein